jgi:hypothetical protein
LLLSRISQEVPQERIWPYLSSDSMIFKKSFRILKMQWMLWMLTTKRSKPLPNSKCLNPPSYK